MPAGSRPKNPQYDDDFYAWTQHQGAVLREMPVVDNRFDHERVAEEIEDLGKSERDAVRSQVRHIIEHLLKLQYSPATDPRAGWMRSVAEARAELGDKISRTLRQDTQRRLPVLYRQVRELALLGLAEFGEEAATHRLPLACPYTLGQLFEDGWYPELLLETP